LLVQTFPLFADFNLKLSHCLQIKMEGFFVWRWLHSGRWDEGLEQLASWVSEGKLQSKETVVEGFEQLPEAFIGMLSGGNTGKMIVKA